MTVYVYRNGAYLRCATGVVFLGSAGPDKGNTGHETSDKGQKHDNYKNLNIHHDTP
jgi:hypothetical protein